MSAYGDTRALLDQVQAGIADHARLLVTIRDAYVTAGFSEAEAFALTLQHAQRVLDAAGGDE